MLSWRHIWQTRRAVGGEDFTIHGCSFCCTRTLEGSVWLVVAALEGGPGFSGSRGLSGLARVRPVVAVVGRGRVVGGTRGWCWLRLLVAAVVGREVPVGVGRVGATAPVGVGRPSCLFPGVGAAVLGVAVGLWGFGSAPEPSGRGLGVSSASPPVG
jgi:hypothetical protein